MGYAQVDVRENNEKESLKGDANMKLSKVAMAVTPSFTRQLFNIAAQYNDVIDFTLGDPDFMTPKHVRAAGCEAINAGKTKYSANAGLRELREVVSKTILKENNVYYDPDSEIIITVGAMQALYLSMLCLLDEDDEVIIPAPFWINYKHMVEMCHGKPVIVSTSEDNNFMVTAETIEGAITDRTKAIIINSPNNPSGIIYDYATVERLCQIAKEKDILIFWDECYKSIVYDGNKVTSVLDFPNMKEHSVIINSFSKKYSMTGWRIGYTAASAELVNAMTMLQENMVSCAPLPSQYAAICALETESDATEQMRQGFQERRDVLVTEINKIDKLHCRKPQGTFYAFVNIKETGLSSVDFAFRLVESKHVAVVPGITYGDCCEGYIRIAYTVNEDKIYEGVRRIKEFVEELG